MAISSPAADVEVLVQELSPRGLMIVVEGVFETLDEAECFVKRVEEMCTECG